MNKNKEARIKSGRDAVALYHVVYEHEGFDESAQNLFKLVQSAQSVKPGKKRMLYLDIEGHRNSEGGLNADMFELLNEFLLGFLRTYR